MGINFILEAGILQTGGGITSIEEIKDIYVDL
jgi:hypothetical protein